jgi:hypothetical protein
VINNQEFADGFGKAVYPEDHQRPHRSGLQSAVGVVCWADGCPILPTANWLKWLG